MIYTLSDYQIGYLAALFFGADSPEKIKVENVGIISETGEMVVSYIKYGTMFRETVKREP